MIPLAESMADAANHVDRFVSDCKAKLEAAPLQPGERRAFPNPWFVVGMPLQVKCELDGSLRWFWGAEEYGVNVSDGVEVE